MIYPKEYLEQKVKEKADQKAWKLFPFKANINKDLGEMTPLQLISYNQETFFDFNSEFLKEKMYASRKEIISNCFKSEWVDDFFVNKRKIDQCIHNSSVRYLGKYQEFKNIYLFNSIFNIT